MSRCGVVVVLFWTSFCAAQLSGRFYLDKKTYAKGEPVFLYFELKNDGQEPESVISADPYSFCAGYHIQVSSDPRPGSACGPRGYAGSCLSSEMTLAPGKTTTDRILLNYEHNVKAPGDYDVDAVRYLGHFADSVQVRKQLHFRVTDETADDRELQALAGQLASKDTKARYEAARVLASMAPRSMESTLIGFVDDPVLKRFAPLALHNLNTERSLAALGELMVKSKPGTYEQMESARYLGETGDEKWFPLLREMAKEHANIYNYVSAAAESGGDEAVPFLLEMMRSKDKEYAVPNAVSGFGYTGSRAAVPILLDLLKSSDLGTSQRALFGLRQLTHRSANGPKWYEDTSSPSSQYARWSRWWTQNGATARIYNADECGEYVVLP